MAKFSKSKKAPKKFNPYLRRLTREEMAKIRGGQGTQSEDLLYEQGSATADVHERVLNTKFYSVSPPIPAPVIRKPATKMTEQAPEKMEE